MDGKYPAICINGKNVHVHRLVWIDNFGKIPTECVIHHKDENKLNWNIENLELLSRSEHIKRHANIVKRPGIKITASKGKIELEFNSIEDAAKFCETYPALVQRVLRGKQRQSHGWKFSRR